MMNLWKSFYSKSESQTCFFPRHPNNRCSLPSSTYTDQNRFSLLDLLLYPFFVVGRKCMYICMSRCQDSNIYRRRRSITKRIVVYKTQTTNFHSSGLVGHVRQQEWLGYNWDQCCCPKLDPIQGQWLYIVTGASARARGNNLCRSFRTTRHSCIPTILK